MSVRERIDGALAALQEGLNPFVAQHLQGSYRNGWIARAKLSVRDGTFAVDRSGNPRFDVTALCSIILDNWDDVFGRIFGKAERKLVHRIRDVRNDFAHQQDFTLDRTIGALEDIESLLNAVGAGPQATFVRKLKEETGRERYGVKPSEPAAQPPKLLEVPVAERAMGAWRDVIVPHPDVQSRRFANAEFAADLYQVWKGEASEEYGDPSQFFARTYLTSGLQSLIGNAARRLTDGGGDPVVELQTSFGGGKTHALLALYHIASGAPPRELQGVSELLASVKVSALPQCRRVVLVGTKIGAGQPSVKPDGTVVRTLWGELAYQLGGPEGYAMVAEADRTATNPGAALDELFKCYGPCLVLIDEWVSYARQLLDDAPHCGGTFETQFTFAQALTESVTAAKGTLLVVSLPVSEEKAEGSDAEVGGVRGREALRRLRNVVARKQANWQPADAAESYAIVRRRLFEPTDGEKEKLRDRAIAKLASFYREKSASFPHHAGEPSYKQKLTECYPIHPELFERLYTEWGSLEQFQRTRGVLRLMAAVIHCLWAAGDRHPLIMSSLLPLEDPNVVGDLVRYLGDPWRSVLARDVVGADSRASRIDERFGNLGRFNATKRVARAVFVATAPQNAEGAMLAQNAGVDLRAIRLACAFPGDNVAVFDDATRRLAEEATHVATDGSRFWFQLAFNLNRRAQDEAGAFELYQIHEELVRRLQALSRERGDFVRVHAAPGNTGDVPDERDTRLVILRPDHTHVARREATDARTFALDCVTKLGQADRRFKNALIFLAPDQNRLADLELTVRQAMAWKKIVDERRKFELTPSQEQTATKRMEETEADAGRALRACWCHVLVPSQAAEPGASISLDERRLESAEPPAAAASDRLRRDGLLNPELGGVNLRNEMDSKHVWADATPYVQLGALWDCFAQYPYMRRLKNEATLREAVLSGVSRFSWSSETFAYAERFDERTGRYEGLIAGPDSALRPIDMVNGLIVRADVASHQIEQDRRGAPGMPLGMPTPGGWLLGTTMPRAPSTSGADRMLPHHFFLRVRAEDPTKLPRIASQIANDIVAHLMSVGGSQVEVSVEVKAEMPDGIEDQVEDKLRKNAAAHGFANPEFNP